MSRSYIPQTLVHAHLPCPPTIPNSIPELHIPSDYDSSSGSFDDAHFLEHALAFSYSPSLNVLARVINNGYTLELRAFDTTIRSDQSQSGKEDDGSRIVRVIFPQQIKSLPEDCIIVSPLDRRVYVLVYTEEITEDASRNMLYRLNFPIGSTKLGKGSRFSFTTRGNDDWMEEFQVPHDMLINCGGVGTWTVVDELNVVLGCGDGGVLRLTRSNRGIHGSWSAHHHRVSSRFRLPSLFSSTSSAEQVISFSNLHVNDDLVLVYALSRDRKLRVWHGLTGALLKTTDVRTSSKEIALRGAQSSPSQSNTSLLPEDASVPLIRIVPHPSIVSKTSHLIVIFLATPHSNSSPGSFLVYRVARSHTGTGEITFAGERTCSFQSVGSAIRGFEVVAPTQVDGADSGWRLWAVWDSKGSVNAESIMMDDLFQFTTYIESAHSSLLHEWQVASQDNIVEKFDSAYFDNMLSLEAMDPTNPDDTYDYSQIFIEHLFHPGRFSMLSLTTALEEYIVLLPRGRAFAEVSQSFASLQKKFERIVGCDLEMTYDPSTGAADVHEYRTKMKSTWLGIWARVRHLDLSARWPIGTAVFGDSLSVITREGCSMVVPQDTCSLIAALDQRGAVAEDVVDLPESALRKTHPALADSSARSNAISIAGAGAHIADVLSRMDHEEQNGSALDAFIAKVDMDVAKPYLADIEVAMESYWVEDVGAYLAEEQQAAVRRLLSECPLVAQGLAQLLSMLSTIAHSPGTVDESLRFSGIGNSLLGASIASTIRARYKLARNVLFVVIFHYAEMSEAGDFDADQDDLVRLLSMALTTYQRYCVLQWVVDRPADDTRSQNARRPIKRRNGDNILSEGFGTLRMREGEEDGVDADKYETAYSLLHSLLARGLSQDVFLDGVGEISAATTAFLTSTLSLYDGLWDNVPLEKDVRLALSILEDGQPVHAGVFTASFPDSSGMIYVKARAYLDIGDIDQSVTQFEKAARGCHDRSLEYLIPHDGLSSLTTDYYRHVVRLYRDRGVEEPIVRFGNLALQSTTPEDPAVKDIWTTIFLAAVSLGMYEKAYITLTSTPYAELKRDFLGQLISRMCEEHQVGQLLNFGFVGFQKDVEDRLRFKAQHSDPLKAPFYHQVLYSWHVTRGDYRSAADVMYQQAKRLEVTQKTRDVSASDLAVKQARSYLAAINALSLLDKQQAWLPNALPQDTSARGTKRRRVTSYIPEEEFSKNTNVLEIITLDDIRAEYTAVLSRLQIAAEFPAILESSRTTLTSEELVGMFVQRGMYDDALRAGAALKVDLSDLFTSLAQRCVQLSSPSTSSYEPPTTWLFRSPITCNLRGPPSALAMRYLQVALQRHDSKKTNWKYRKVVSEQFMRMNKAYRGSWKMPSWMVDSEMERDAEGWIARALEEGWVVQAVEWSSELIRRSTPPELLPRKADAAYIPYNLIDRVVAATEDGPEKDDKVLQAKVDGLKEELKRRIEGLRKVRIA